MLNFVRFISLQLKIKRCLTSFWAMFQFYSPWKRQKTKFSGVFEGYEVITLAKNELDPCSV